MCLMLEVSAHNKAFQSDSAHAVRLCVWSQAPIVTLKRPSHALRLKAALYEKKMSYIDYYKSCNRTYATLLIYTGETLPDEVTRVLGISPTRISLAVDTPRRNLNGWFLSSQDVIESKDSRSQIDYIIEVISPVKEKIVQLQSAGFDIGVLCFWESATGNGGPTLSPRQMRVLGELNIELSWDIWFADSK